MSQQEETEPVEQVELALHWHLYGNTPEDFMVHGASVADPTFAATLSSVAGKPYVTSFDHEPTDTEIAEALA